MQQHRLLILTSHAIQYQAPFHRLLAAQPNLSVKVLFCCEWGAKPFQDPGFGQQVQWDVPLLEGYEWEVLPNWSPREHPSHALGLLNPSVIEHIRSGRHDALLVYGWSHLSAWLAMLAGFDCGLPVIVRGESNLLPTMSSGKAAVKNAVLRSAFRCVAGFLAIGRHNADFYRHYGVPEEKLFLAPYSVNNEYFFGRAQELRPRREELRGRHGIPQGLPVVLFSGKLIDKKRPMDLLRAFHHATRSQSAGLIYLGDGHLRPQLEQYVQANQLQHVLFAGFRNQTEVADYFSMADVFVLPSGLEPWGLVVNEALCFGLPVIVSDQVGSGGDLVRDGENGCVFPAGDTEALADKLGLLLGDAELRREMGAVSSRVIKSWSYAECVQGVQACLQFVARRSPRAAATAS